MLDIHPEYLRRGLRGWKERKLKALAAQAQRAAEAPAPEPVAPPVVLAEPVKTYRTERPTQPKNESHANQRRPKLAKARA